MTDRYQKIRQALAKRPTPGPWNLKDGRTDTVENAQGYPVCAVHWHPDERYGHGTRAAYIAACDPNTIRELLVERDALAAEVERLRRGPHPAITHCDNCGCDWLDNGLNPIGCPYCKQTASVDGAKEADLWRCTVCGRVGTVGRCCGEETREPVNHAVLSEGDSND